MSFTPAEWGLLFVVVLVIIMQVVQGSQIWDLEQEVRDLRAKQAAINSNFHERLRLALEAVKALEGMVDATARYVGIKKKDEP